METAILALFQSGKSCNCGILQLRYKHQFSISIYRNCSIHKKTRIQNSTENLLVFVINQTYLFNAQMKNFFLRSDFCNKTSFFLMLFLTCDFCLFFPTSILCIRYKPFQAKHEVLLPQLQDFSDCISTNFVRIKSIALD